MTGEDEGGRLLPSSVQPGGREPAPGELALVQAFINSQYDLEVEHEPTCSRRRARCASGCSPAA